MSNTNTNNSELQLTPVEVSMLLSMLDRKSLVLSQALLTGKSFNREGDSKQLDMLNQLECKLLAISKAATY